MSYAGGVRRVDPPDGPPRLAPWSEAFGVTVPTWTFVVRAEGRLAGKFEGIVGSGELRTVTQAVMSG